MLRSYFSAREYAFEDGRLGEDRSVAAPFQRQAESVTYTADGSALMFGSEGVRSDVVRVETEGGSGGSGGGREQGKPSGSGSAGDEAGGEEGDGKGGAGLGAAIVVGVAVLWFALRRKRGQG